MCKQQPTKPRNLTNVRNPQPLAARLGVFSRLKFSGLMPPRCQFPKDWAALSVVTEFVTFLRVVTILQCQNVT